ncbi:MAG: Bifunctional homocysteine S-methyltransferase/5,10-methylenetetrahydrofolate reductase [Candidatus Thorarchaeota archaeon]|nr:MAG: Bifunctional homocysteine S-methyltransferase/5,10-methylenetetrahydrofolate reductase [Candidatus Thorarchaeota archaeon]
MSSMVCGHILLNAGIEPIIQMSARDRNRVLFQSELYGAHALGLENVLFITGDHTLLGSHPKTKMVYDIDSIQALQLAKHLMSGKDLAGADLEGTPQFFLGSTFNPYADPMPLQAMRVSKKKQAGAQFFQTQAIYDIPRFEKFLSHIPVEDIKIIAGIIPLKGPKMALFMNQRIPGFKIPDTMIHRLEMAGNGLAGLDKRTAIRAEGLNIAVETIEQVRELPGIDGIHIMAVGWEESLPEIVKRSGLLPRPR